MDAVSEVFNAGRALCGAVMDEHLNAQVLATYSAYVEAFRANDVAALDKLIHYPLAYIGEGRTTLLDAFPIQPAELMADQAVA